MAKLVIDTLQFIQVQQQKSKGMMDARAPAHFPLQRVYKSAVVRQSRQRVMGRLMTNLVLVFLSVGHVDSCADATHNFSGGRAQRPEVHLKVAILVPVLEMRSRSVECLRMLRDGRPVRVLAS